MAILMEIALAFALLLQSFEYLGMKNEFRVGGTWAGPDVILNQLFNFHLYLRLLLLVFILTVAIARFFQLDFEVYSFLSLLPMAWLGMLASQLIIVIRTNALPSGGAEGLLFWLQLMVLWIHTTGHQTSALVFVSILILSSYAIAGLRKLAKADWRNGQALRGYLQKSWYRIPPCIRVRSDGSHAPSPSSNGSLLKIISLAIILTQVALPLFLFLPNGFWIFLVLALVFHIANFWIFSLNRFVWAWVAGFPAVYFLYLQIH